MEQWPLLKMEGTVLGAVDLGAGQIGGQQVGGKLDAMEIPLHPHAQHIDGAGLRQARRTFHQDMPVRQQGEEHPFDQDFLADHLAAGIAAQALHGLLCVG